MRKTRYDRVFIVLAMLGATCAGAVRAADSLPGVPADPSNPGSKTHTHQFQESHVTCAGRKIALFVPVAPTAAALDLKSGGVFRSPYLYGASAGDRGVPGLSDDVIRNF